MFIHISGSNRLINKLAIKIFSVSHSCVVDLCSVVGGGKIFVTFLKKVLVT